MSLDGRTLHTAPAPVDEFATVDGLPAPLRDRVDGLERFPLATTNAFYRGTWRADGRSVLVKQFWTAPRNLAPVWRAWSSIESPYIVPLLYHYPPEPVDELGQYNVEVTEFHSHGSLDRFTQTRPSGRLDDEQARAVLRQVSLALRALHGGSVPSGRPPVVHADIKPENIVVRSVEPLEVCITDFGIAREISGGTAPGTAEMTPAYAAPLVENVLNPAADWWSLGITMLELLQGYNPWQNPTNGEWMSDEDIRTKINEEPIDTSGAPGRWRDLVSGLLSWDPDKRWGAAHVAEWLAGGEPDVDRNIGPPGSAASAFLFADDEYTLPAELAKAFGRHWGDAARLVAGVRREGLIAWCREVSPRLGNAVAGILANYEKFRARSGANPDRVVADLVVVLAPGVPPRFMGHTVHEAGLLELARRGQEGDPEAVRVLAVLLRSSSLFAYGQREYRDLENTAVQWERWHHLTEGLATSILPAGPPAALPAMLLRAVIDEGFRNDTVARGRQLLEDRMLRFNEGVQRLAAALPQYQRDEAAFFVLLVASEPMLRRQPRGAPGGADGKLPPVPAATGAVGLEPPAPPAPTGLRRLLRLRPAPPPRRPTWREYQRRRRTPRRRLLRAVKAATAVIGSAVLTGVGGAGVAQWSTPRTGVLVAAMLAMAGAGLVGAVALDGPRVAGLLLGLWAGTVGGALFATLAGGLVGTLVGTGSGWLMFWFCWVAAIMLMTARGFVRGVSR